MEHITFETARRLKDAGFPQPKSVEGREIWHKGELLSATDILQHLPGMTLSFEEGNWVVRTAVFDDYGYDEETFDESVEKCGGVEISRHQNSAEACAEAWFLENPKKPTCRKCGGEMNAGIALENLVAGSSEWPDGDMSGATFGMSTDTKAVRVMKCEKCGHSFKA